MVMMGMDRNKLSMFMLQRKSTNTLVDFDTAAGTNGWLTLKEVDDTINKINNLPEPQFRDALRNLYPE